MNRTFHYRAVAALLTVSTLLTGFASAQIVKPIPASKAYVDSEIAEEAAARIAADATKQPLDSDLTALAGFTLTANTFPARSSSGAVAAKSITDTALAFVASPTSANFASAITDEVGSGSALLGDQAVSTTSNARFAQLGVGTTASAYTFDVFGGDIRLSQGGGARTMIIDNQGMSFNTIATIGGTWSGAGMLEVVGSSGAPSRNGVYFRGAASQSGDAFLYRSSSSVDLARIKSDGGGYFAGPVDFAGAVLTGDAANILAQRNGTNSQESRIYNTYTSSTNHERGILKWDANVFKIGTEKGSGGGTARDLALVTDGTTRFTLGATTGTGTFTGTVVSPTFQGTGTDIILKDGLGNQAFRSVNATTWTDALATQYFQVGTSGGAGAFTSQNGTNFSRLAVFAEKFQVTSGARTTSPVPVDRFEVISNSDVKVFSVTNAGNVSAAGDLIANAAGKGLRLKSGTGQRAGNATLVAGTVTVSNTTVTANTLVHLTRKTAGGTIGEATYTLSAGNSFTITSDSASDTSTFTYLLTELD
jgi:hypothetical protein